MPVACGFVDCVYAVCTIYDKNQKKEEIRHTHTAPNLHLHIILNEDIQFIV